MSNIDAYGWESASLDDSTEVDPNGRNRHERYHAQFDDVVPETVEEQGFVEKWKEWGLTEKDIRMNLEIRRKK